MINYTIVPGWVTWCIPEAEHTNDTPFCQFDDCACHFQPERIERYLVQPIERHEMTIGEALDRYYCREKVEIA